MNQPAKNSMPLFFKTPQLLQADRHKNAGIRQDLTMEFARKTNSIIITAGEFIEAAKFYPIIFTAGDTPSPVVAVGLEQNNYFIDAKGNWKTETYIPAYTRQYPFVLVEIPNSNQLSLCIDEGAEHYVEKSKKPETSRLFEDDGKPTQYSKNALDFCAAVQKQHVYTQSFCQELKKLGLLAPQQMEAKLPSGRTITMGGFQVIDQEKLRTLADDQITELHKKGFLPLIYYIVLSATNWQKLWSMAEPVKKN